MRGQAYTGRPLSRPNQCNIVRCSKIKTDRLHWRLWGSLLKSAPQGYYRDDIELIVIVTILLMPPVFLLASSPCFFNDEKDIHHHHRHYSHTARLSAFDFAFLFRIYRVYPTANSIVMELCSNGTSFVDTNMELPLRWNSAILTKGPISYQSSQFSAVLKMTKLLIFLEKK